MRIEQTAWSELLKEADPSKRVYLAEQLVGQLDTDTTDEIVALFADSSDETVRYCAAGVLLTIFRNNRALLNPALHDKIERAAGKVLRKEYFGMFSTRCFNILRLENSELAENFLLNEVDPARLRAQELVPYFYALESSGSIGAINKLRELERVPGEIGRQATQSLGNIGKLTRAQLESLVSQFKSERTASLLYKIFYVYLRFQIGKPVQPIRELLGEPARVDEDNHPRRLIYLAEAPRAEVQILYDQNGIVTDTVADD